MLISLNNLKVGAFLLFMSPAVFADSLVQSGLEKMKRDGVDAAVNVWMSGSMLSRAGIPEQLRSQLGTLTQLCGELEDWEVIETQRYGSRASHQTFVLNHQRCPIFAKFSTYQRRGVETLTRINFNATFEKLTD